MLLSWVLIDTARIKKDLVNLARVYDRRSKMAQEDLDRLARSVTSIEDASDATVKVVTDLAQQIRDAADDPDEMRALADRIDAKAKVLGDAVAANAKPSPTPMQSRR